MRGKFLGPWSAARTLDEHSTGRSPGYTCSHVTDSGSLISCKTLPTHCGNRWSFHKVDNVGPQLLQGFCGELIFSVGSL